MMADKRSRKHNVEAIELAVARQKVGLPQAEFDVLFGVFKRTLQDLEQGRREPSSAAKSLIENAMKRPDVLVEVLGKVAWSAL